jgi:hypothetical protein
LIERTGRAPPGPGESLVTFGQYNELITDTFTPVTTDPRNADSPTLDGKLVLFDGAKRDRDPYDGDIAVSGLTDYLTHDVGAAARDVLADLADHQRGRLDTARLDQRLHPAAVRLSDVVGR